MKILKKKPELRSGEKFPCYLQFKPRIPSEVKSIHVPLSPITPYVAPIKEKLLLHAVHAVLEEKYTQQQQYSGVSSVLSSLCSVQLAMETFNAKHTQP